MSSLLRTVLQLEFNVHEIHSLALLILRAICATAMLFCSLCRTVLKYYQNTVMVIKENSDLDDDEPDAAEEATLAPVSSAPNQDSMTAGNA